MSIPPTAAPPMGESSRPSAPPPKRPRPIIRGMGGGNTILVNKSQRKNPLLSSIRGVGWEMAEIVPDFQMGTTAVLFLSLMYHRAKPYYIHERIQKLGRSFELRVLLVMNDVHDSQTDIRDLSRMALINDLTIVMAWTNEEAANYIEMYKLFEKKPPDAIRGRPKAEYAQQIESLLTAVDKVNKTDVVTLTSHLGSLTSIVRTPADRLACLTGFGPAKVRNLREAFHQPFRVGETRTMRQRKVQEALAIAERGEELPEQWNGPRNTTTPTSAPGAADSLLPPPGPGPAGPPAQPPQPTGSSSLMPPPPPAPEKRNETPLPDNPSLRAALAFRRAGKTSLAPKGAFGPSSAAPSAEESRGTKRTREEEGQEESSTLPPAAAPEPPMEAEDELYLELRDLEDLDESAQLELALKLSGAAGDKDKDDASKEAMPPPPKPDPRPDTGKRPAQFSPEPDIDLELEDLDDLTEEEQLAIAMQLSQQGL